jgi:hypothetical protein
MIRRNVVTFSILIFAIIAGGTSVFFSAMRQIVRTNVVRNYLG